MTDSFMPHLEQLNAEECAFLEKLIKEQEFLINANGYLRLSSIIKDISEIINDEDMAYLYQKEHIKSIVEEAANDIERIQFIGSEVGAIVAGIKFPSSSVKAYLNKYREWKCDD
jgi:hypothetical protein